MKVTNEQKQRLAALQITHLDTIARMRKALTLGERDSAIKVCVDLVFGEPDMEVREAFMLWRMQKMNISEMTIRPDEDRRDRPYRTISQQSDLTITSPVLAAMASSCEIVRPKLKRGDKARLAPRYDNLLEKQTTTHRRGDR